MIANTKNFRISKKLKNKIKEQLRNKRKQQLGNLKGCPWITKIHKIGKDTKTGKDTKKTHVSSDRLKKAEQHLPIGNSYQTLADLGEDDMDVCLQTQRPPPAKSKITPILPPDD